MGPAESSSHPRRHNSAWNPFATGACTWILAAMLLVMAAWMLVDMEVMEDENQERTLKLSARKLRNPASIQLRPQRAISAMTGTSNRLQKEAAAGIAGHRTWNATSDGQSRPKIYVYPLPQQWQECEKGSMRYTIYGAQHALPDHLHNSSHIVFEPSMAEFFYVPVVFYCLNHKAIALANEVVQYIRRQLPYWDRNNGRDHIFLFTRDHGCSPHPSRACFTPLHIGCALPDGTHGFFARIHDLPEYCGFSTSDGMASPILKNSIILSHWGLTTPELGCDWWTRLHDFGSCPHRRHPGLIPSHLFFPPCHAPDKDVVIPVTGVDNGKFVAAQHSRRGGERVRTVKGVQWYSGCTPDCLVKELNKLKPTELPAKPYTFSYVQIVSDQEEIVSEQMKLLRDALARGEALEEPTTPEAPARDTNLSASIERRGTTGEAWKRLTGNPLKLPDAQPNIDLAVARSKLYVLYFAGGSGLRQYDATYSHGVRQLVLAMFRNNTGYKLVDRHKDGEQGGNVFRDMSLSVFCLAPSGAGWGVRMQQSLMNGCIPVVIGDDVEMPYEDILPYKDFALRVSQHAIYMLPTLLEAVMAEPGRVEAMQQRLSCAWMHLSWSQEHGRALAGLICSLRRRLYGANTIFPMMDWEHCQLSCGGSETLPFDLDYRAKDVHALSLEDVDRRMQYLDMQTEKKASIESF